MMPVLGADIDRLDEVLMALEPRIQERIEPYLDGLEEIRIVAGYPLTVKQGERMIALDLEVTLDDVRYTRAHLGGFRSDFRAGIERTLHRFSGIPDRYGSLVGIVVRLARAFPGVAKPLEPYLKRMNALMLIGRPGTGKTSLLRDIVHTCAEPETVGQRCVVADTSNEIGGDGTLPHPSLGKALRVQVGEPSRQGEVLRMIIANLTPLYLVVDEIGYHGDDVKHIETCARRGVKVIATLHGNVLRDVVHNPSFWPLVGHVDLSTRRRVADPVFDMALELNDKEHWTLYTNLGGAVDDILRGKEPQGVALEFSAS